ncbi:MAG: AAA family ATPase [Betaproteobacteria bacterium]|nr:AAA family ATPase [Betaproteobacteria bacterium]MDH5210105.1 AAA family ATPase [Betaproteobacteria bacterium]
MENVNQSKGSRAAADVSALLRARNPLLWIVTREEARVERLIVEAAQAASYEPRFWDCATGVTNFAGEPREGGERLTDPAAVLTEIRESTARQVWVLRDIPAWLRDPSVLRSLRSLARALPMAPREEARAVIVLTPQSDIPPELAGHAIVIEWPLPDRSEVAAILDGAIAALPEDMRKDAAPNGTRDQAIDAAVGLTAEEAQACFAKSLVSTRRIDPATVSGEKRRVIAREKVLEWFDPLPGGLDAVGGLDALKAWLGARRAAFSPKARAYGLPAPKGCLLVGVPGCGKSLTAKAIATAWAMPLLRLDMGALKSKYVGESEGNIRKALRVAEAVAPCVLWLDEIEKALAGATQGAADGGTSADALGTVLSWMQDRAGSVFVVATSNDVSALPPELLRKGRFDELFFVDLPDNEERAEIIAATLRTHNRNLDLESIYKVAKVCDGFTGAEIAALVPEGLFAAFAEEERALVAEDLIVAARATVPLAQTAAEKISALRKWAKGRARPATTPDVSASNRAPRLDV